MDNYCELYKSELDKIIIDKGLSGDGINIPLGLNMKQWNSGCDELLWSGEPISSIELTTPLSAFERVKFVLGHSGYNKCINEFSTNNTVFNLNPFFRVANNTGQAAFQINPWTFNENKLNWSGHCFTRNYYAGNGAFLDYGSSAEYYSAECYPISEIWGINKKLQMDITINQTEGGTITADPLSGFPNTHVNLSKTADAGMYFSGYDISGASINYDSFDLIDSDVNVIGRWSDAPVIRNITLETEGSGTLEANALSGYTTDLIQFTATPINDNYMLTNLDISGAELSGDEFYLQYSDVNIKAIFDLASGLIYSSTDATTAGEATYCDVTLPDSGNYYVFYIDYKASVGGAGGRHYRFNKTWNWYCRQHYVVGSPCTIKNGAFTDVNSTVMGNITVDRAVIHYAKNTNVGNFSAYKIIVDKTNSNTSAYLNNEYCGSAVCNNGLQLTSMKMDATNELSNGNTGKNCKVAWFGSFDKALEWVG